jgi:hypothetical protein
MSYSKHTSFGSMLSSTQGQLTQGSVLSVAVQYHNQISSSSEHMYCERAAVQRIKAVDYDSTALICVTHINIT